MQLSTLAPERRVPADRIFRAALISRSSIRLKPIKTDLRAFVGLAFEQLVQQWLATRPEVLPFRPEAIGSHWRQNVQVDAVAVNWQTKELLLGECRWGEGQVSRSRMRELLERKAPRITKNLGEDWTLHHASFAREGFTDAAAAFACEQDVLLVDVSQIDADLHVAVDLCPGQGPPSPARAVPRRLKDS